MTYTTAIELSDLMKGECPTPSSAQATINTDHNSNITNACNSGNRMKHQSLLSAQRKVHVHQERLNLIKYSIDITKFDCSCWRWYFTGPTSDGSAGPTSDGSAGPTSDGSAGPTSDGSAGPTSGGSAGPTDLYKAMMSSCALERYSGISLAWCA